MSSHFPVADTKIEQPEGTGEMASSIQWTSQKRVFFARKSLVEPLIGMLLLIVFTPVILLTWAIVRLTSSGPGFYFQLRVGLHKRLFQVVKLRTMRHDAESDGQAVWSTRHDRRMTFVGKVLRKMHLDELPQLVNVARGEMSLVGPRPERPTICDGLCKQIDGYYDRVEIKPGITGLSQINLPPDETVADVKRKQILDLHYINEVNWWMEFRILIATAFRLFGIKGDTTMKLMRLSRISLLDETTVESGFNPVHTTADQLQWHVQIPQTYGARTTSPTHTTPDSIVDHRPDVIFPHIEIDSDRFYLPASSLNEVS